MDNKKINKGQIRAIRGSVVDAFFPQFLPKINNQLKSGEAIIEVTLHRPEFDTCNRFLAI